MENNNDDNDDGDEGNSVDSQNNDRNELVDKDVDEVGNVNDEEGKVEEGEINEEGNSKVQIERFSKFITYCGDQNNLVLEENSKNNNINIEKEPIQDKKKVKKEKIKVKCPTCRNCYRVYEDEIVENEQVLFYINKHKALESTKLTLSNNYIFCKECKKTSKYLTHEADFPDHKTFRILDKNFKELKNNLMNFYLGQKVISEQANTSEIGGKDKNDKNDENGILKNKALKVLSPILSCEINKLNENENVNVNENDKKENNININESNNDKVTVIKSKAKGRKPAKKATKTNSVNVNVVSKDEYNKELFLDIFKSFNFLNDFNNSGEKIIKLNEELSTDLAKNNFSNTDRLYIRLKNTLSNIKSNTNMSILTINKLLANLPKVEALIYSNVKDQISSLASTVNKNVYDYQKKFNISYDEDDNMLLFDGRIKKYEVIPYKHVFEGFTSKKKIKDGNNYNMEKNYSNKLDVNDTGRYIYFLGKKDDESKKFRIYDTKTRKLSKKANIPMKFNDTNPLTLGDDIYIIGGKNEESEYLTSCYWYCFEKNKWTELPSLGIERKSKTIFMVNNKIYVMLGLYSAIDDDEDYNRLNNEIEVLDIIKKDPWEKFTLKNISIPFHNAISYIIKDTSVVIFGGETNENDDAFLKGYFIDLEKYESIGEYSIQKKVSSLMPSSIYRDIVLASSPEEETHFLVFDMKD